MGNRAATLHVAILYRHANRAIDSVESTADDPVIIKDIVYVVSNDRKHDHRFVQRFKEMLVRDYYRARDLPLPEMVHEWCDGCASQYKCAAAFFDISRSKETLGFYTVRNFFETAHAKGPQDGAGANFKQAASLAQLNTKGKWFGLLKTPEMLARWGREEYVKRPEHSYAKSRTSFNAKFVYFIPLEGEDAVDREAPKNFDSVSGTLKLHSVLGVRAGHLLVRQRVCYCAWCYGRRCCD